MKPKSKSALVRVVIFSVVVIFVTVSIIDLHTPTLPPLVLDFKCLDAKVGCPIKIDQGSRDFFEKGIEKAIRDSHRLGTLSDVYVSIMRFNVSILNSSTGYVKVASTTNQKINLDIQCIGEILPYGAKKEVENYFVLSDAIGGLVTSVNSYIISCPGFLLTKDNLKGLPPIPPNSDVVLEAGPQFTPIFSADPLSWLLVSVFNLIVIVGFFPVLREGWRFLKKGFDYFD